MEEKLARELNAFDDACMAAIRNNFITCLPKIAAMLKSIAISEGLYGFMRKVTEEFDFEAEFNQAKVPSGMSGYKLIPPTNITDFIAFSFCMLLQIDLETIDFANLLDTYYKDYAEGLNGSYHKFCIEIIDKFRRAVFTLFREESSPRERKPEPIASGAVQEVCAILTDAINLVMQDEKLSAREKEEYLVLTDALSHAVLEGNKSLSYALAIGFRHALGGLKKLANHVDSVWNLMKRSRLI